ncbi:MAG: hypothetical protein WKF89_08510 [Chitinophagaceae bacterium]
MNESETDVTDFLRRIVWSMCAGLIWLFINMAAGISGGLLFFEKKPRVANIIFYIWLVASLTALLWFLYKTWQKRFPHG